MWQATEKKQIVRDDFFCRKRLFGMAKWTFRFEYSILVFLQKTNFERNFLSHSFNLLKSVFYCIAHRNHFSSFKF